MNNKKTFRPIKKKDVDNKPNKRYSEEEIQRIIKENEFIEGPKGFFKIKKKKG